MEKQQLYLAGQGLHGEVHCSLFTKGCIQEHHPFFYANERHESQQPDLHLLYIAIDARRYNCIPILTFDQPLVEIIYDHSC